ncbi:hypothetical protein JYU34_017447 [Plutella xylostella]|uniref:PI-PLC X domain-containing protein 1 n=1 Tax=Plutella xylostella TaxID=51655 RepID=A0ABQ7Q165_PLUXY|nr:hypothetical protein JYU34_017447 [Plutella xylostella]
MAVSWVTVLALAATALGASIALRTLAVPGRAPPTEFQLKSSRIIRTLKRVSDKDTLEKSSCGRVWVTVHSPELRLSTTRRLQDAIELNWDFNGCSNVPKQIGLFDARPEDFSQALRTYPLDSVSGFLITNVSLGDAALPGGWESGGGYKGGHCLWPRVAAGGDRVDTYNCLKIQPTWMEDNMNKIAELRIGELALPGTHNAGSWKFNTAFNTASRDNIVLCQDRSVWAQLVHGIRYLDFRIAYYGAGHEDERYWLNHNMVRVRPLVPLLREIRVFLDATKEVVFLDAHHFPIGFYEPDGSPIRKVHAGLLEIVQRELGPHLADASEFHTGFGTRGPKLQTLVEANKRLLFSYVDNAIVGENNWLWPILPHLWANTNNPDTLLAYLDRAISSSPLPHARSPLYSAMAQTTFNVWDIFKGSLRVSADAVNRNVTERLGTKWRNQANIVSTDFFLGNDVIDVSIALSVERGGRL